MTVRCDGVGSELNVTKNTASSATQMSRVLRTRVVGAGAMMKFYFKRATVRACTVVLICRRRPSSRG